MTTDSSRSSSVWIYRSLSIFPLHFLSGFLDTMGFVKECVIVLNIYLFGRLLAQPLSNCTTVDDDLMNCYNIYQPVTFIDANSTWQQNCQNIECFLQCMSDAVGDCYLTDKYFTYEMAVQTVYYRASCSNLEVNVASLLECQPYNTTCLVETDAINVALAAINNYNEGNYAAYKETYCNYTKLQRGCISIDTLENCTATVASFYESILIVSTSYSQCGNDQNHDYFTIYNGSIGCVNPYTLGSTVEMTSMSSLLSETITSSPAAPSTSSSFSISSPTTRSSSSSTSSSTMSSSSLTSFFTSLLSTSSPPSTSTLSSKYPSSTTTTSSASSLSSSSSIKSSSSSLSSSALSTDMESSSSSSFTSSTSSPLHSTLDTSISPKAELGSSSTSSTNTAGCSYPVIQSSLGKCLTVTMDTFNTSTADAALRDYCDNVECNIQCYIDSVGECYKDDAFFTFDTETAKVSNRVYCNNYTETLFAFATCQFDDFSCLSSFASTLTTDILPLYKDGKFTEYRKEYCSLLTPFKSCLTASTVVGCDVEQATLFKDIFLASLSYSKCEEQNHAYFTTYGHDVTCNIASISRTVL